MSVGNMQTLLKNPLIDNPEMAKRWLDHQKTTQASKHSNNATQNAQRWAPQAIRCIQKHLNGGLVDFHDIDHILPRRMNTTWVISYLLRIGYLTRRGNRSLYRINHQWTQNGGQI